MNDMLSITVDGRPVEVKSGAMLLESLESIGVTVPTLCHHPSLEPSGACRLCVVEITHPDWDGWADVVTSCLYPVKEGLVVRTGSRPVIDVRRSVLDLLLARCPEAEEVRRIAGEYGVAETSYVEPDLDNRRCILCTLCVRVCAEIGASAIGTAGGSHPQDNMQPYLCVNFVIALVGIFPSRS